MEILENLKGKLAFLIRADRLHCGGWGDGRGPDGVGGAALSSVWEDKSLFVRGGLDMEKNQ